MHGQVIEISRYGAAETLTLKPVPLPQGPRDHEVLIQVHYSGINFADILMRLGLYPDAPARPFVPGYEVSGVILEVGQAVKHLKAGQYVIAGTRFGGYASHIKLPAQWVIPLPSHLDLAQGAALPVNLITAHLALNEFGRVRKGDRLLLEGASGGVGVIAMQLAKELGCETYGLTSSPHKKPFIESYGAQALTFEELRDQTTYQNFQLILNSSGGHNVKEQYQRLAKGGQLVCIGIQSSTRQGRRHLIDLAKMFLQTPRFSLFRLMMDSRSVGGFNALKYMEDETALKRLVGVIGQTKVIPHVDRVFAAEDIAKAHHLLETKQAKGKVLIQWEA